MSVEKLYDRLPVSLQNMAISMYGYYWRKKRFGGCFLDEVKSTRDREFYSYEQWKDYQTKNLRNLLMYAYDNVPFYKERWDENRIERGFLQNISLDQIKLLPFTTKDDFRKYGNNKMLSKDLSKGSYRKSSGSTGTPVNIYMPDYVAQKFSALMETRVRNWAGVNYKTPRGMIGGRRILPKSDIIPPFYRYNIFEKQTYFSAYHISKDTVQDYLHGIKKNKVEWMTGYAMSNFFIADYINKMGMEVPKLKAVITSSEKLTLEMRNIISSVYDCKVFDSYSGAEACGLISETGNGELLVSPDAGIMEFLNKDGNDVAFGEIGEIVSTGLINFDQPLIRYRIGDMAKLSQNQTIKSNHSMIKVDEIIGRVEDVIISKDGRKLVRFHSLFLDIEGLVQSQLIQNTYTDFIIKLIVDRTLFNKVSSERIINSRLESQIGKITVRYEYVLNMPVGNNGKVKAVISKI